MKEVSSFIWEFCWGLFWFLIALIPTSIGYYLKIKKIKMKQKKIQFDVLRKILLDLKKAEKIEEPFEQKKIIFSVLLMLMDYCSDVFNKNERKKIQKYQILLIEKEVSFESLQLIKFELMKIINRKLDK
jgi:hypothetical protein